MEDKCIPRIDKNKRLTYGGYSVYINDYNRKSTDLEDAKNLAMRKCIEEGVSGAGIIGKSDVEFFCLIASEESKKQ